MPGIFIFYGLPLNNKTGTGQRFNTFRYRDYLLERNVYDQIILIFDDENMIIHVLNHSAKNSCCATIHIDPFPSKLF